MSQLSSSLPPAPQALVAVPAAQSAVPDATLAASNQVNATSFVEQLAKLLQTLTPQAEQATVRAATAADQSAIPATAASKPVEEDAAIPATAAAQSQVSAPETLVIATALPPPDIPSIRPRNTGSGKAKAEPVMPARRASAISSQSGAAVCLALPPDTAAALQSAALATPNAEPRHNSALHQVGDLVPLHRSFDRLHEGRPSSGYQARDPLRSWPEYRCRCHAPGSPLRRYSRFRPN